MAIPKDGFFRWHMDGGGIPRGTRGKPPPRPDEMDDMTQMLEMRYNRSLHQMMENVNLSARSMYHHAKYSSVKSAPSSPIEFVVNRLSYKPNVRMWVEGDRVLVMAMDCPDRDHPERIIPVTSRQEIPHSMAQGQDSTEEMVAWVRNCLRQLEEHEMDEWFRLDKKLVHDPHRGEIRVDWKRGKELGY